jgi:hypothetical protein
LARVFISYSHDSEAHKKRVYQVAERLRRDGVTISIDRDMLPGGPSGGWASWADDQVRSAEIVLVVCTAIYRQRFEGNQPSGAGLGAVCEAAAIRNFIFESSGFNEKVRPIIFDPDDYEHVPNQLRRYQAFQPNKDSSYADLLAWVRDPTGISATPQTEIPAIKWPSAEPDLGWQIADRIAEIEIFQRMATGRSQRRILILRGGTGTGKSLLLHEFYNYARRLNLSAALLDFKGCPSLDELFEALRLDLGRQVLRHSYLATGTARFYQLISDLQQLSVPLLLLLDDYQQASVDAQKWIESQLLPRLERVPAVVVVISGQQVPDYAARPWQVLVEARELQPIHRVEDWLEYSQRRWQSHHMTADHVEALTLATGGNPAQVSALLEVMARQRFDLPE